jgi:protein-disulfide isomerase
MKKITSSILVIAVIAIALVAYMFGAAKTPAVSADGLTKADVEKIVSDYIDNNPEQIMRSVLAFQQRSETERSSQALSQFKSRVFDNSASPIAGNPNGDVTIAEFFDYNCGYCKHAFENLNKLIAEDKNVKVVFKEFPILSPMSETAARWALAAHLQGDDKYFTFHQYLMTYQGRIDESTLEKAATAAGLDITKVKTDAQSDAIGELIKSNRDLGMQLGINGTPAFAIGDRIYPGAIELEQMKQIIADVRQGKKAE